MIPIARPGRDLMNVIGEADADFLGTLKIACRGHVSFVMVAPN